MFASKQAENAAEYLGKGSHVNIVGRVRNNNYQKDGEDVYALAFTVEEIDYLDSRADALARRQRSAADTDDGPDRAADDAATLVVPATRRGRAGRSMSAAHA